jgi:hypothetical protein
MNREFIEVHTLEDGKRLCVRSADVVAVYECDAERIMPHVIKPAHTLVEFAHGGNAEIVETYDEVCDMIFRAEM